MKTNKQFIKLVNFKILIKLISFKKIKKKTLIYTKFVIQYYIVGFGVSLFITRF